MRETPGAITAEHVACLAAMLESPLQHTQRCVEQLSFVPSGGQRWTRTLQVSIPSPALSQSDSERGWHVISLGLFRQQRIPDLAVRDCNGARLNLLTRDQHGNALARAALLGRLRLVRPDFDVASLSSTELAVYDRMMQAAYRLFTTVGSERVLAGLIFDMAAQFTHLARSWSNNPPSPQGQVAVNVQRKVFVDWASGFVSGTRYLCWVRARPGETVNLEVTYTTADARAALEPRTAWWRALLRRDWRPEARMRLYRRLGIAPINSAFRVPSEERGASYYFTIDPPDNTEVTYMDWGDGDTIVKPDAELDSSSHAVHFHTRQTGGPKAISVYLRSSPRAHKQLAAGALLNLVFVYMVARGRLSNMRDATAAQSWLLLTPAALLAYIAEQQRHYYAMATSRQRGLMWYYLAVTLAFVIAVVFGLPQGGKDSMTWGWKATVLAWLLACSSFALLAFMAPLGRFYDWAIERLTQQEAQREVRRRSGKAGHVPAAMWQCYDRAVLRFSDWLLRGAILLTVCGALALLVTNWGRDIPIVGSGKAEGNSLAAQADPSLLHPSLSPWRTSVGDAGR